MGVERKVHTAGSKDRVALAAPEGDRMVNELAGHHGVHPGIPSRYREGPLQSHPIPPRARGRSLPFLV
jgi:hypothetical protein